MAVIVSLSFSERWRLAAFFALAVSLTDTETLPAAPSVFEPRPTSTDFGRA